MFIKEIGKNASEYKGKTKERQRNYIITLEGGFPRLSPQPSGLRTAGLAPDEQMVS